MNDVEFLRKQAFPPTPAEDAIRLRRIADRLEALEAALHKLTDEPVTDTDNAGAPMCAYCGGWTPKGEIAHDIGCVWEEARKLVGR